MAIPSTAATVVVPPSVAPVELLESVSVTLSVAPTTGLPSESVTATRTAGEITAFTSTLSGGCVRNVSR